MTGGICGSEGKRYIETMMILSLLWMNNKVWFMNGDGAWKDVEVG